MYYTILVMFGLIKNKLLKYLDFSFQKTDLLVIFVLIISISCIKIFNITEIPENSILENISLIPLFIAVVLCYRFKKYKIFFNVLALLFILMILRELSYGRVIFCQVPNSPNEFYPWSHYKYGYLAHIMVGIYIFAMALYGIINKIWLNIFEIINKVKFPVWTLGCGVIFTILQIYFEGTHNTCGEETVEFALYCTIVSLCIIYTKKLK